MSNYRRVSPWLQNEPALQVTPSVACCFGVNQAIFLQQVQFWLRTSKHLIQGRYWVYNTFADWHKQMPFFDERTLMRIVERLRDTGVLLTSKEFNRSPTDRTQWYAIDIEEFDRQMEAWFAEKEAKEAAERAAEEAKINGSQPLRQSVIMEHDNLSQSNMTDCHTLEHDNLSQSYIEQKNITQKRKQDIGAAGAASQPPGPDPADVVMDSGKQKPKLTDHPAVQAYRALYDRYPTKAQMKIIAQADPPLDKWQLSITKWAGRQYNPTDIDGMLDWALHPEKMEHKPAGRKSKGGGVYVQADDTTPSQEQLDEQAAMDAWAREHYPERFGLPPKT